MPNEKNAQWQLEIDDESFIWKRSALDLYRWSRSGASHFGLMILISAMSDELYRSYGLLIAILVGSIVSIAAIRIRVEKPKHNIASISQWMKLHWMFTFLNLAIFSSYTTWLMLSPEYGNAAIIMLVSSIACCITGSRIYCMFPRHGIACILILMLPSNLVLYAAETSNIPLGFIVSLVIFYYIVVTNAAFRDYRVQLEKEVILESAKSDLRVLSLKDELTSLANRRHYNAIINQAFSVAERSGETFSLVLLDLDYFKKINDNYGHAVGDACLVHVAGILSSCCMRESDFVARIGGEEFALILHNTCTEEAKVLVIRILQELNNLPVLTNGQSITVTGSFGIATFDSSKDSSPDDLYGRADEMTYAAKQEGRNRVKSD